MVSEAEPRESEDGGVIGAPNREDRRLNAGDREGERLGDNLERSECDARRRIGGSSVGRFGLAELVGDADSPTVLMSAGNINPFREPVLSYEGG